jgi:hypothetical protein
MTTLKEPGIFLAHFIGEVNPFNSLENTCKWAKSIGFTGTGQQRKI